MSAENYLLKKLTVRIFFLSHSTRKISDVEEKTHTTFYREKWVRMQRARTNIIIGGREWEEGGQQSITNDGDFVISVGDLFFLDILQRSFADI